jgi:hypothetical protein
MGPGSVVHSTSGPVQVWPAIVPTAVSGVPTFRDQAITKNLFKTFGYPVSDTQFQIISRYNDNILLEQMFDPERAMWMTSAIGNIQAAKTADNTANLAQNQATSAIEHIEVFMTNFTNESADPGNMWHQLRNNLFVPMAILLLFLGAVVAQVVAIVAQGTNVLGNISPFDGLQRAVIAVFLIPFTQLIMSWGIDVGNSISESIPTAYYTQFGRDMYQDAICAQKRAFPVTPANNNLNAIIPYTAPNSITGTIEGMDFDILSGWNPCMTAAPVSTGGVPDEAEQFVMTASRFLSNTGNSTLAMTWNVLCAFQTAYLYYLWCMGPIVAALWVWPMQQLRNALPSWIDGLITLCFWSLFWNTSVLLMACFYGINTNGDTGTMYMSALNLLANLSVKFAFNFSGLSTSLGFMAESAMMQAMGAGQGGGSAAKGGAGAGAHGAGAGGGTQHGGMEGGVAHGGYGHGGAGSFVPGASGGYAGATQVEAGGASVAGGIPAGTSVGGGMVTGGAFAGADGGSLGAGGGADISGGTGGALAGTGYGSGLGTGAHEAGLAGGNWPASNPATAGEYAVGGAGGAITPAVGGSAAPGDIANAQGAGFNNPDPTGLAPAGSEYSASATGAVPGGATPPPVGAGGTEYASGLTPASNEVNLAGGNITTPTAPGEFAVGGSGGAFTGGAAGNANYDLGNTNNPAGVGGPPTSDSQLVGFDPGAAASGSNPYALNVDPSLGAGNTSFSGPPLTGDPNPNLPPLPSDASVNQALDPYATPAGSSLPPTSDPSLTVTGYYPAADQSYTTPAAQSYEYNSNTYAAADRPDVRYTDPGVPQSTPDYTYNTNYAAAGSTPPEGQYVPPAAPQQEVQYTPPAPDYTSNNYTTATPPEHRSPEYQQGYIAEVRHAETAPIMAPPAEVVAPIIIPVAPVQYQYSAPEQYATQQAAPVEQRVVEQPAPQAPQEVQVAQSQPTPQAPPPPPQPSAIDYGLGGALAAAMTSRTQSSPPSTTPTDTRQAEAQQAEAKAVAEHQRQSLQQQMAALALNQLKRKRKREEDEQNPPPPSSLV